MPGFNNSGQDISLVLDPDVVMAEAGNLMTVTLLSPVEDGVRRVTEVQVFIEVCVKSPYLRPIIALAKDKENITLGGGLKNKNDGINKECVLVWLAHVHNLSQQQMGELGLHNVSVVAVWEAIQIWTYNEKRDNIKDLQSWFNCWYETAIAKTDLDLYTAQLLAFPCQAFDHAVGFARVTKYIAYNNVGGSKEHRPKGIKMNTLHLSPNDFIGPINHARGGLKTTLHKSIWKKANNMLRFDTGKCGCWDSTIGQYLAALVKIDAFPIEDAVSRSSIQDILDRMKGFTFTYTPDCRRCRVVDFAYVVQMARQNAQGYFDGLCLDCMDRSKPKGKDLDEEYWKINSCDGRGRWDSRCRIKHGQPSWYVSWLGRDWDKQQLMKMARGEEVYDEDDE